MTKVEPLLKWAGGKRWLASSQSHLFPSVEGRHIEPFLGSGAVFFSTMPERALLTDLNSKLIDFYQIVRDDHELFMRYFAEFASSHTREQYYEVRKQKFRSRAKQAAQFLYLNRVCFNGIYRENLRGEFNVPIGSKTSAKLATDNFPAASKLLSRAVLRSCDFEETIDTAEVGDFLYVDPPYTTKHNLNGFVKYNQKIFSWNDQERLASAVIRAMERGVKVLVSNADHADVRELYSGKLELYSVARNNVIAASSSNRGQITELIACNYDVSPTIESNTQISLGL